MVWLYSPLRDSHSNVAWLWFSLGPYNLFLSSFSWLAEFSFFWLLRLKSLLSCRLLAHVASVHFLFTCVSHLVISDSLWTHGLWPAKFHGILQARILEWVAKPSSRGSSQPRDWNLVFCIAGRFFTVWAMSEALFFSQKFLHLRVIKCVLSPSHTLIRSTSPII